MVDTWTLKLSRTSSWSQLNASVLFVFAAGSGTGILSIHPLADPVHLSYPVNGFPHQVPYKALFIVVVPINYNLLRPGWTAKMIRNWCVSLKVWRGDGLAGSGLGIVTVSGLKGTSTFIADCKSNHQSLTHKSVFTNLCWTVEGARLVLTVTHLHAEYYGEVKI